MIKKDSVQDEKLIEALLFVYGEPMNIKKIAKITKKTESALRNTLESLKERLENQSGLRLVEKNQEFQLVTDPEYAPLIGKLFTKEHREELTRAALEVLAIVAYEGPVSRTEIETIRGVNSAFTIRGLMLRGLIEKTSDSRVPRYDLSFAAARRFGTTKKEDLPQWGEIRREISEARNALANINERNT